MKKIIILTTSICLFLTSCTTRPENIPASYVSHEIYENKTCSQLSTAMIDAQAELTRVEKKQNTKSNVDVLTVFLIIVPISQLSGAYDAEVAKQKGVVQDIKTAQIKKNCM